jgi:hypothetical protein
VGLVDVQSGTLQLPDLFHEFGGTFNFGLNSASNYGKVTYSNPAVLAGALSVNANGGFVPAATNTFVILSYPSFTGAFASTNLVALPFPLSWQVRDNPANVTLTVISSSPTLGFSRSGTNLTVNWPSTTDASFILQSTTSLSPPITWANVTNTVTTSGGQNTVNFPIVGTHLFLRMTSPQ